MRSCDLCLVVSLQGGVRPHRIPECRSVYGEMFRPMPDNQSIAEPADPKHHRRLRPKRNNADSSRYARIRTRRWSGPVMHRQCPVGRAAIVSTQNHSKRCYKLPCSITSLCSTTEVISGWQPSTPIFLVSPPFVSVESPDKQ